MKKIILIGLLIAIVLISGCVEKECEIKEDCPEKTCFTKDCIDSNCYYSPIVPCCGNGKCETGETYKECADDCEKTGHYRESEVWGGEILITGDVYMEKNLKILPGTVVKFAVQDDQQDGWEIPADGYNDLDPARLTSYVKTHSSLIIVGRLNASGTAEKRILFTSAAENPKTADWEEICPGGDGSLIEYSTIEWSRSGIATCLDGSIPNTIFRNNILRQTLWGSITIDWSSAQVYNNEIWETGHQGIAVHGGNPIIKNNRIYDSHGGIVVQRGSAIVENNTMINVGFGIYIEGEATPILKNNHVEMAPQNSTKTWCYESFCYPMFGAPAGTPILTEVYKKDLPRYAVPAYKIEGENYIVELPLEAEEWIVYGLKNDKWNKVSVEIKDNKYQLSSDYSMYVFIPNPTEEEKDSERFNEEHSDIYRFMSV